MNNVSIKLLDDKSIITFRGALNISHIVALKQELEELITFDNNIEIQIESIESLDITFIQLLVSMRNSCVSKNTSFNIACQLSDDLLSLMKNAGLNDFLNN